MSSTCPKTCTQLSTAAIFISVGIIQFLAGIILLKSEYIYLLAGVDFIVATMNIVLGGSLGISSSVWEKKQNKVSSKSNARQNVLAGLYISVMVINSTTAIIMIMGDGNKLLTAPDEITRNTATTFVVELLACAYVTSVCSPIVCIVIALVCLSGNRIKLEDDMNRKRSISTKESYGWVFEDKNRTKALSQVVCSPTSSSISDDNVFIDKPQAGRKHFLSKKLSRKSLSRSSISLRELKSPLEIWAEKRRKVLEEITSSKQTFFPDDPQLPQFGNARTILPRVKRTSLMHSRNEINSAIPRTKSLGDIKIRMNLSGTPQAGCKFLFDGINGNISYTHNDRDLKSDVTHNRSNVRLEHWVSAKNRYAEGLENSKEGFIHRRGLKEQKSSASVKVSKFHTGSSSNYDSIREEILNENNMEIAEQPLKSKLNAISKLKSKLEKIDSAEEPILENQAKIMKSFKKVERKTKWSESDIEKRFSAEQIPERTVFSESSENIAKNSWAGEVIPITIHSSTKNRTRSLPIMEVDSRTSKCKNSPEYIDYNIDFPLNKYQEKSSQFRDQKENNLEKFAVTYPKNSAIKQFDKKQSVAQRITSMGSIAEAATEDNVISDKNSVLIPLRCDSNDQNTDTESIDTLSSVSSKKKVIKTSSSNILRRLWSGNGTEDKAVAAKSISNLIMDADSLVGLTEEQLKARTNRIRQLRKSVQQRQATEKSKLKNEI